MRNRYAPALPIAICSIGLICLGTIGHAGCFGAICEEVTFSRTHSADSIYGATAYAIDCGAIGSFNLRIRLTRKAWFGYTRQRQVLNVDGRFTATFEWPEARRLRVKVACEWAGQCSEAQKQNVQEAMASADRAWGDLKIEYASK